MSKWVEFNVNEYVRVKLTPEGIKLLEREHEEVFGPLIDKYPFRMPEIDKDGWTRFRAWDLMNKLGKHCHLGATNPFETTIQFEVKQPDQETEVCPHGIRAPHECKECAESLVMTKDQLCSRCDTFGGKETYANQACLPIGGRIVCVDWCIHHIVAALNAAGIGTTVSCCGHGKMDGHIGLKDGRELIIRKALWNEYSRTMQKIDDCTAHELPAEDHARVWLIKERDDIKHAFKNFHRLLCERFGYAHDEKDWDRDQLSLIEHIATRPVPPPADDARALLRKVIAEGGGAEEWPEIAEYLARYSGATKGDSP